jgi:hypothetical protein
MNEMTMKMGLVELYQLVGDNTGVRFLYEDLPGVVVTIGFTLEEDEEEDDGEGYDDGSDGGTGAGGGDEPNEQRGPGTGSSFH